jgi:hypothetical protein
MSIHNMIASVMSGHNVLYVLFANPSRRERYVSTSTQQNAPTVLDCSRHLNAFCTPITRRSKDVARRNKNRRSKET